MTTEEFAKARDEYNQRRRMLSKTPGRSKYVPRGVREERSKRAFETSTGEAKAFAKAFGGKPDSQNEAIEKFLNEEFAVSFDSVASPSPFWKAIKCSEHRFAVRNANRLYVGALAYVAGMFLWLKSLNPIQLEYHMGMLLELSRRKAIKNDQQLLAAIHTVAIHQDRATDKEKRSARVTVRRDTCAVLWLLSQKLSPMEFVSYQEKNGGGVHEWYLNYRREHPREKHGNGVAGDKRSAPLRASGSESAQEEGSQGSSGSGDAKASAGEDAETVLEVSKQKRAPECLCLFPATCIGREIVHRFKPKEGDYVVTVYLADDSYAGATLQRAVKLHVPGPTAAIRNRRLDRILRSLMRSGTPYKI